jgi:hypothetical protein
VVQRLDDPGIVVAGVIDARRNLVGVQIVLGYGWHSSLREAGSAASQSDSASCGRMTGIRSWIEFIRPFGSVVRIVTHEIVSLSPS